MRKLIHGMSLAILIAVLVGASVASAFEIKDTDSVPDTATNWSTTMTVEKFDPTDPDHPVQYFGECGSQAHRDP